jgi:hypothetical protein
MLLQAIAQKVANSNFNEQCKGALLAIFSAYFLYQLVIFLSWTAMSPDEISFIAGSKVFLFFDRSSPPLNYGTLFWAFISMLKTPLLMRIVFCCLFLAIPYFCF